MRCLLLKVRAPFQSTESKDDELSDEEAWQIMMKPRTAEEVEKDTMFVKEMARIRAQGPRVLGVTEESFKRNLEVFGQDSYIPAVGTKIYLGYLRFVPIRFFAAS